MSFFSGVAEGYADTEQRKALRNSSKSGNVEVHDKTTDHAGSDGDLGSQVQDDREHTPQAPVFFGQPVHTI
jgi:hypothetical protein